MKKTECNHDGWLEHLGNQWYECGDCGAYISKATIPQSVNDDLKHKHWTGNIAEGERYA